MTTSELRQAILSGHVTRKLIRQFAEKVRPPTDRAACFRWTGAVTGASDYHDGRPNFRGLSAAKVAWIFRYREPWPVGHEAAHLCRVRWCVNPTHVQPMTPDEHREYDGEHWTDNLSECAR